MLQLVLVIAEPASAELEELLRASQTCPVHVGTTLSADGSCAMCDLDEAAIRALISNPWVATDGQCRFCGGYHPANSH